MVLTQLLISDTSADDDGFFNEVDSDTKGTLKGADGALVVGGGVAADVNVTGKKGASAATGGTHVGVFTYTIADSGASNNLMWGFGPTSILRRNKYVIGSKIYDDNKHRTG